MDLHPFCWYVSIISTKDIDPPVEKSSRLEFFLFKRVAKFQSCYLTGMDLVSWSLLNSFNESSYYLYHRFYYWPAPRFRAAFAARKRGDKRSSCQPIQHLEERSQTNNGTERTDTSHDMTTRIDMSLNEASLNTTARIETYIDTARSPHWYKS